ncbi:DUF3667 domain-containing protein [Sphingobacterium sp. Lzh-3]|uniref:DUF3667 domain-containing protein n=1 Tax=unclassified Sphingobacterium TaxID=2609468 RepID=UPI00295350CD|nr:DUF3667 domain-containing protein [Sphingobacterium sp. UGAL515B_05]WON93997.1 DUF3667 domain-containing protein [Sphingobacterium sp. UGAL515B_05]
MNNRCLNCDRAIEANFCSNCGQTAATHRYSLKHFFIHDFIHGIFHFDNGFLYTMKELFTRPGHSVREYIEGRRAKHFNYFATVIIVLTINYFLSKFTKVDLQNVLNQESVSGLSKVIKDYSKFVTFIVIPFNALMSYLIFKKSGQNYTENLVLNIFLLAAVVSLRFFITFTLILTDDSSTILTVNLLFVILIFLYTIIFFYQYFSVYHYNKIELVLRVIIIATLFIITKQGLNTIINTIGLRYLN